MSYLAQVAGMELTCQSARHWIPLRPIATRDLRCLKKTLRKPQLKSWWVLMFTRNGHNQWVPATMHVDEAGWNYLTYNDPWTGGEGFMYSITSDTAKFAVKP